MNHQKKMNSVTPLRKYKKLKSNLKFDKYSASNMSSSTYKHPKRVRDTSDLLLSQHLPQVVYIQPITLTTGNGTDLAMMTTQHMMLLRDRSIDRIWCGLQWPLIFWEGPFKLVFFSCERDLCVYGLFLSGLKV
jgi:hypothetical protein